MAHSNASGGHKPIHLRLLKSLPNLEDSKISPSQEFQFITKIEKDCVWFNDKLFKYGFFYEVKVVGGKTFEDPSEKFG